MQSTVKARRAAAFADLKRGLALLGMTIRRTAEGEFRVNYQGGAESTAYYTDDMGDARDSALAMVQSRIEREAQLRAIGLPATAARRDALAAMGA